MRVGGWAGLLGWSVAAGWCCCRCGCLMRRGAQGAAWQAARATHAGATHGAAVAPVFATAAHGELGGHFQMGGLRRGVGGGGGGARLGIGLGCGGWVVGAGCGGRVWLRACGGVSPWCPSFPSLGPPPQPLPAAPQRRRAAARARTRRRARPSGRRWCFGSGSSQREAEAAPLQQVPHRPSSCQSPCHGQRVVWHTTEGCGRGVAFAHCAGVAEVASYGDRCRPMCSRTALAEGSGRGEGRISGTPAPRFGSS